MSSIQFYFGFLEYFFNFVKPLKVRVFHYYFVIGVVSLSQHLPIFPYQNLEIREHHNKLW